MVSAAVNFATEKAYVSIDDTTTAPADLCEAVAGIGGSASEVGPEQVPAEERSDHWAVRASVRPGCCRSQP